MLLETNVMVDESKFYIVFHIEVLVFIGHQKHQLQSQNHDEYFWRPV